MKRLHTYTYQYDYKSKRYNRILSKVWYIYDRFKRIYTVPITQLRPIVIFLLKQCKNEEIEIKKRNSYKPYQCTIPFNKNITPYGYQESYIEYLYKTKYPNKLVQIQMGKGKTVIASKAISLLGVRTLIVIQPKYMDKWIDDVSNLLTIDKEDIEIIKGSDKLRKLIKRAKDDINSISNIIIASNKTIQSYITYYQDFPDNKVYGCIPEKLMKLLGIGVILTDEVHEHFHNTYTMLLYFNQPTFIGLTATLSSRDSTMNFLYETVFPIEHRSNELPVDNYITVYETIYTLSNPDKAKYEGVMGYNHNTYETYILSNIKLRDRYLEMIFHYVTIGYLNHRVTGDKAIVYCSSIKMCTIASKYIQRHTRLKVRRYVGEDDYENIKDGDIIVSTIQSGGTALDIKGLITVILTVSIDSLTANQQIPGRLRYKKGKDLRYYFLYTTSIKKHVEYSVRRKRVVLPLSKRYNIIEYNKRV